MFRNKQHAREPIEHVQLSMLVAIVLQFLLPDHYVLGPRLLLVFVETLLLIALSFTTPKDPVFRSIGRRINVFMLLALTGGANIYSLVEIANRLLQTGKIGNGRVLILTAINIYLTNVIIFALWYWEMDGGGPGERRKAPTHERDFLFPQNQDGAASHAGWHPTFIDYLYVSSTNAMAFSPTDTMPLSRRAKLLMLTQATASLVVIALIAARAVNILS